MFQLHIALEPLDYEQRVLAANQGLDLLDTLRTLLNKAPVTLDTTPWRDQIPRAEEQVQKKRPTIAVVGSTGAGKSSFINAVIDEEDLLPTNCMRACTATITEISHHDGPTRYSAEIEFLSRDEWETELQEGFAILFDSAGRIGRDATNEETDAGVFYSKLRAVYADVDRAGLENSTVQQLLEHPVAQFLGRTETIAGNEPREFASRLQTIIDSSEKADACDSNSTYWPIIRRVKLHVKAEALATGVILVDLPGIQDSTPARAKIAENYKQSCSGLVITAPIHRAADDRVAKNLLGPTFRRQVMMDGGYGSMTFVCTKVDEINTQEIVKSAPEVKAELEKIVAAAQMVKDERTSQQAELANLGADRVKAQSALDMALARLSVLQDTQSLTPAINENGKRPLDQTQDATDAPLSAIEAKYRAAVSEATSHLQQVTSNEEVIKMKIAELEHQLTLVESSKRTVCIKYRNDYVVNAIKKDFIAGVREFDQECAEDDNIETDLVSRNRDYNKLAAELPVLTVSSRAYQQAMDRLGDEQAIHGFPSLEDTGIPNAIRHFQAVTLKVQMKNLAFFLGMISKTFNTVSLWVTNEERATVVSEEQRRQIAPVLEARLKTLQAGFSRTINEFIDSLRRSVRVLISNHLDVARNLATSQSKTTAAAWEGLAYPTYKAICRRAGAYCSHSGEAYDWNEELLSPMLTYLAPQWEKAFTESLGGLLEEFSAKMTKRIQTFHQSLPAILGPLGAEVRRPFELLARQHVEHQLTIDELAGVVADSVQRKQKDISRSLKPSVAQSMRAAYEYCRNESGPGSVKRMTEHMKDHVASSQSMFREAATLCTTQLGALLEEAKIMLKSEANRLHEEISRSYMTTLCGNVTGVQQDYDKEARARFVVDLKEYLELCRSSFNELCPGAVPEFDYDQNKGDGPQEEDGIREWAAAALQAATINLDESSDDDALPLTAGGKAWGKAALYKNAFAVKSKVSKADKPKTQATTTGKAKGKTQGKSRSGGARATAKGKKTRPAGAKPAKAAQTAKADKPAKAHDADDTGSDNTSDDDSDDDYKDDKGGRAAKTIETGETSAGAEPAATADIDVAEANASKAAASPELSLFVKQEEDDDVGSTWRQRRAPGGTADDGEHEVITIDDD